MAESSHNTQNPQGSPPATATTAGARRRSSGFMPAFESLSQHHQAGMDRRQSMSDQQSKGGVFSQFFHNNFGRNSK